MWVVIVEFITENAVSLGGAAAVIAIVEKLFAPFRTLAKRKQKPQQVEIIQPEDNPRLDIVSFLQIQKKMRADIKAELEDAHADERGTLLAKIAELDARIANPDQALQAANKRIAKLETLLEREGNDIGGDRLAKARTALEAGDYSIADEIFAEVEVRADLEVKSAARAAFGRGEIAEAEIRWADAADHYSKAARLDPAFDKLFKAGEFLWLAGHHQQAVSMMSRLVTLARKEFGNKHENTAAALNNLATGYKSAEDYEKAEPLYSEALEIARDTIGRGHPDYAVGLSNYAGVLNALGRREEAELLFRDALEIDNKTIGVTHPNYANHLNNLAEFLRSVERYNEAEPMFREALGIFRDTRGVGHPEYATYLGNLAALLQETNRFGEAEQLYLEALKIMRKTVDTSHPNYGILLNNLAELMWLMGCPEKVVPVMREVIQITETALGADHPNSKIARANLEHFLSVEFGANTTPNL